MGVIGHDYNVIRRRIAELYGERRPTVTIGGVDVPCVPFRHTQTTAPDMYGDIQNVDAAVIVFADQLTELGIAVPRAGSSVRYRGVVYRVASCNEGAGGYQYTLGLTKAMG